MINQKLKNLYKAIIKLEFFFFFFAIFTNYRNKAEIAKMQWILHFTYVHMIINLNKND